MKKKKILTLEGIIEFCKNSKFDEVVETATEALTITNTNKPIGKIEPSLFNFSASFTLSGGSYPCESLPCRLKKVINLAKFASVYSNCTTIYNPFDFAYIFINPQRKLNPSDKSKLENKFRFNTINAFSIVLELWPLIEHGLIVISKTIYTVCKDCKKKRERKINSVKSELDKIAEKTILPLLKREVKIEYLNQEGFIHLIGINSLIGEDLFIHFLNKKFPSYLFENGKTIKMANIKYNNPLIQHIMKEAIDSLMCQKIGIIENLTQTYLTTNLIEKTLLEKMGKQAESKALNFFVKGLPVIQGMPYESIIQIREKYSDEFQSFQNHVSELINNAKKFDSQIEFDLYVNNKLKDGLKDLKNIQEEGKKKLVKKGLINGIFLGASVTSAYISTTSVTNFDVRPLFLIAKAGYDCINLLPEAGTLEEKIRKNPLYFYFKLTGQKQ